MGSSIACREREVSDKSDGRRMSVSDSDSHAKGQGVYVCWGVDTEPMAGMVHRCCGDVRGINSVQKK